jgi:membrane protein YqaA with SNARE-associated domain
MNGVAALGGLFLSAFLAATLLPAQSEGVLAALAIVGDWPAWLLVIVASAGNVLGAVVNWLLGRAVTSLRDRSWFPVSEAALARAQGWYGRYGRWSLLMSWLPVVGDPLTLAAGMLREPLASFLVLVTIGKTARYAVIALAASGLT